MSSSGAQQTNSETHNSENKEQAGWYPWNNSESSRTILSAETIYTLLREQKLEFEAKLLGLRNELLTVRTEMLGLKETLMSLREDYSKIKPIIDERKRNAMLRRGQPFPFIPEHTKPENETRKSSMTKPESTSSNLQQ